MSEEKSRKSITLYIIAIIYVILSIILLSIAIYTVIDLIGISVKYGGLATAMKSGTLFQAFFATLCGVIGKIS